MNKDDVLEIVEDLKQFVTATVSQQTAELRGEFQGLRGEFNELGDEFQGLRGEFQGLRGDVRNIELKVDGLIDFVTEAIDTANDTSGQQLQDHETRIVRLEKTQSV